MKLSFVIPAYNEEAGIGPCLDAIFRELKTVRVDAEIIVVNNNSTDRTKEVALKYPGVRVVDELHKGIVWARQAGYLASTGDLIANIDADNRLTKGWVSKVLEEFSKHPDVVAFSGPFIYYDLPRKMGILVKLFYYIGFWIHFINDRVFRVASVLQGGNFVLRREALKAIGGYDTRIDFYGEDADVARRIRKVGRVVFTFDLPIHSSGRRLAEEGLLTIGVRYGINYLWVAFFGRPFTQKSIVVRPKNDGNALEYKPVNRAREWIIAAAVIFIILITFGIVGFFGYKLVLFLIGR
jgi:glycosyltransferase involved in cell wall biosynthesis